MLMGCDEASKSMNKTIYIELPGSHFSNYAYAVGTVTEERKGQYKIRIDQIKAKPDSDNELLKQMRLGRFVELPKDRVLEGKGAVKVVEQSLEQVQALERIVQNVLSLNQVGPETFKTLQLVADTGDQPEISCTLDLVAAQETSPLYRDNQLQIDTAAKAIENNTRILEDYDRFSQARHALKNSGNQDACIYLAIRMIRETDFDLRAYVADLKGSDTERLKEQMQPVIAINRSLLDFQTGHFAEIPNGLDEEGYVQEKLANLTTDLRRYYAFNYFRDFRHDLESFGQVSEVIDRFQKDKEDSSVLVELLGGEILTERNLNEDYLNYYKLNKQIPARMSQDLDDDNYFERAKEGFTVVNPTDEQKLLGLERYVHDFPEGRHVDEARVLIDELKARLSAPPAPPTGLPEVRVPEEPREIPSQLPPAQP
jgi:hypothetical protein